MLKNAWKWSLLLAGSMATLQLGACVSQWLLQTFILNAVN